MSRPATAVVRSAADRPELVAIAEAWAQQVGDLGEPAADDGPRLLLWPALWRLTPGHAAAALDDLANGCDVVLGPLIGGGLYLLGLARALPELPHLDTQVWADHDVVQLGVEIQRLGLEIGILRTERPLRTPADVRAALADPLLPSDVRAALEVER